MAGTEAENAMLEQLAAIAQDLQRMRMTQEGHSRKLEEMEAGKAAPQKSSDPDTGLGAVSSQRAGSSSLEGGGDGDAAAGLSQMMDGAGRETAAVKQGLLDSLGFSPIAVDPEYLDLVLRSRQECVTRSTLPVPADGPIVDRAWCVVGEQPASVQLWPPVLFEARDALFVRNPWQANMFRKVRDVNGLSSSKAQMREGQMVSNTLLWTEMATISLQLMCNRMKELGDSVDPACRSLCETASAYLGVAYQALREHADDHAVALQSPDAVTLHRELRSSTKASSLLTPEAQLNLRVLQNATIAARTKAIAGRRAGGTWKDGKDDATTTPRGGAPAESKGAPKGT